MIIVNYKSKRKLKKDIGKALAVSQSGLWGWSGKPFFVTNQNKSFRATVVLESGIIISVR